MDSTEGQDKRDAFEHLHCSHGRGDPLYCFNCWREAMVKAFEVEKRTIHETLCALGMSYARMRELAAGAQQCYTDRMMMACAIAVLGFERR
jgi:hypothetical protein